MLDNWPRTTLPNGEGANVEIFTELILMYKDQLVSLDAVKNGTIIIDPKTLARNPNYGEEQLLVPSTLQKRKNLYKMLGFPDDYFKDKGKSNLDGGWNDLDSVRVYFYKSYGFKFTDNKQELYKAYASNEYVKKTYLAQQGLDVNAESYLDRTFDTTVIGTAVVPYEYDPNRYVNSSNPRGGFKPPPKSTLEAVKYQILANVLNGACYSFDRLAIPSKEDYVAGLNPYGASAITIPNVYTPAGPTVYINNTYAIHHRNNEYEDGTVYNTGDFASIVTNFPAPLFGLPIPVVNQREKIQASYLNIVNLYTSALTSGTTLRIRKLRVRSITYPKSLGTPNPHWQEGSSFPENTPTVGGIAVTIEIDLKYEVVTPAQSSSPIFQSMLDMLALRSEDSQSVKFSAPVSYNDGGAYYYTEQSATLADSTVDFSSITDLTSGIEGLSYKPILVDRFRALSIPEVTNIYSLLGFRTTADERGKWQQFTEEVLPYLVVVVALVTSYFFPVAAPYLLSLSTILLAGGQYWASTRGWGKGVTQFGIAGQVLGYASVVYGVASTAIKKAGEQIILREVLANAIESTVKSQVISFTVSKVTEVVSQGVNSVFGAEAGAIFGTTANIVTQYSLGVRLTVSTITGSLNNGLRMYAAMSASEITPKLLSDEEQAILDEIEKEEREAEFRQGTAIFYDEDLRVMYENTWTDMVDRTVDNVEQFDSRIDSFHEQKYN